MSQSCAKLSPHPPAERLARKTTTHQRFNRCETSLNPKQTNPLRRRTRGKRRGHPSKLSQQHPGPLTYEATLNRQVELRGRIKKLKAKKARRHKKSTAACASEVASTITTNATASSFPALGKTTAALAGPTCVEDQSINTSFYHNQEHARDISHTSNTHGEASHDRRDLSPDELAMITAAGLFPEFDSNDMSGVEELSDTDYMESDSGPDL